LTAWSAAFLLAALLDDPRLRFPAFLAAAGAATAAWWAIGRLARNGEISRGVFWAALTLAAGARLWALFLPPAFSEDVFRYVFEGRSVWALGPWFPFLHAPAEAPALGAPAALLDASWLRINHPELPTIYPPLSYATFAIAAGLGELAGGGHLVILKLLLIAADVGTGLLLAGALRAAKRPVEEALWWALSPLVIFEIGREGHADSLVTFGLALGIRGFLSMRTRVGQLGFVIAALAKLNGLVAILASLRAKPRAIAPLALLFVLAVPFVAIGPDAGRSLGEYATRWRSGDGAFSILLALANAILGGDYATVLGAVITQHQLARAFAVILFGAAAVRILRAPIPLESVPAKAGALILALLLLTPSFHPWYGLWLLPFAPFMGALETASLALVSAAWLGHHAGHLELIDGRWADLWWVRALMHGPAWALLLRAGVTAGRGEARVRELCPSRKAS
jgi:hypothetical protein